MQRVVDWERNFRGSIQRSKGWWGGHTNTDTSSILKYFCNIKLMFCSGDLDASLVHVQSGVDQGLDDLRHELLGHVSIVRGWIGGASVCAYKIIQRNQLLSAIEMGNPGTTPSSNISAKLRHWKIVVWGTPEGTLKLGQMALVPTEVPLLFMTVVDHCISLSTSHLLVKVVPSPCQSGAQDSIVFHYFPQFLNCIFWIYLCLLDSLTECRLEDDDLMTMEGALFSSNKI